jgi:dihydrolipoamide dehydrogenase
LAEQFDVVVLGGGPGGYAAALYGASAGLDVALIEEDRVGGTCLHRGCIPAKELLQTAEVLRTVSGAKEFGVDVGQQPMLDLATSQTRKQKVVERLARGLEGLLAKRDVTVVPGTGRVVDARERHVRVSDGSELRGGALVLATGSAPRTLSGFEVDGGRVLHSDQVLALSEVPGRVLIVGAGAVGCEFASLLSDLGSEVTLVEALPGILPGVDPEVADVVARSFRKRGVRLHTNVRTTGIAGNRHELTVSYETPEGPEQAVVDATIVCVGRRPRSEGIGLEGSGVAVDERGYVSVDPLMRTTMPGVYAVGDVVDTPQLAHVGFAEAIIAVKTILGERATPIDYGTVPWGIYCHPEVAFTGLTEEDARRLGHDVVTSVHHFAGNGRALIIGEPEGLVKVVAERGGAILGVHIAGPLATELLAEGYLAVNWGATAEEVATFVHPHPTLSELFGESALSLSGRGLHA